MSIASELAAYERLAPAGGYVRTWPEEETVVRRKGSPRWDEVEWNLCDSEIARRHKCRPSTVHYARKRYAPESNSEDGSRDRRSWWYRAHNDQALPLRTAQRHSQPEPKKE